MNAPHRLSGSKKTSRIILATTIAFLVPQLAAAQATPAPGPTTRSGKPVDPAAVENLNRINDDRVKRGLKPIPAPGYTYIPPAQRVTAPTAAQAVVGTAAGGSSKSTATTAPRIAPVAAPAAGPVRELRWIELVNKPEFWPAVCTLKTTMQFDRGVTIPAGQTVKVDGVLGNEVELSTLDNKVQFSAAPEETDVLVKANQEYAKLTPKQRELSYDALANQRELWPYRVKVTQTFDLGRGQRVHPGDEGVLMKFERGQLLLVSEKLRTTYDVPPQATDLMAQARQFVEDSNGAPSRVGRELEGKLVNSVTGKPDAIDDAAAKRYYVFYRGSSTCPITRKFTPSLVKYYNEAKATHPEFEIIYIMTETPADTGVFAKELGFSWPAVEYETTGKMPLTGQVFGSLLPQLVVMDGGGKVLANGIQHTAPAALQKLDALLRQPQ